MKVIQWIVVFGSFGLGSLAIGQGEQVKFFNVPIEVPVEIPADSSEVIQNLKEFAEKEREAAEKRIAEATESARVVLQTHAERESKAGNRSGATAIRESVSIPEKSPMVTKGLTGYWVSIRKETVHVVILQNGGECTWTSIKGGKSTTVPCSWEESQGGAKLFYNRDRKRENEIKVSGSGLSFALGGRVFEKAK